MPSESGWRGAPQRSQPRSARPRAPAPPHGLSHPCGLSHRIFTQAAAEYGLYPVEDCEWWLVPGARPEPAFDTARAQGQYAGFRMLAPRYGGSQDDKEMEKISKLYAAFAFRKVTWAGQGRVAEGVWAAGRQWQGKGPPPANAPWPSIFRIPSG